VTGGAARRAIRDAAPLCPAPALPEADRSVMRRHVQDHSAGPAFVGPVPTAVSAAACHPADNDTIRPELVPARAESLGVRSQLGTTPFSHMRSIAVASSAASACAWKTLTGCDERTGGKPARSSFPVGNHRSRARELPADHVSTLPPTRMKISEIRSGS